MKRTTVMLVALAAALAAVVAITLGAVVADRDDGMREAMRGGMMGPGSTSEPDWRHGDDWDSMGPMGMGPMTAWATGGGESAYLVEMVAHHQEAVDAAGALARSDRPEMRDFGRSIVSTQTAQIEQMEDWLARWYPAVSTRSDYRPMMGDLSGLDGDELDRTFLEHMIAHHMVAVMMSHQLLGQGTDHEAVAGLGRSIRDDQHGEIVQMQRWLQQWFDIDWHPPMHG